MADEIFYARIKPVKRDRQHVRSYSVFGLKFQIGRWYRLKRFITATVQNVKQDKLDLFEYMQDARNEHHVNSDNIFDVVETEAEARKIEENEKLAEQEKSPVSMAVDLAGPSPAGAIEAPAKRRPGRPRKNPAPAGDIGFGEG